MKNYWKSIEELNRGPSEPGTSRDSQFSKHLFEEISGKMTSGNFASRRDFLKTCGFSLAAATLAASCEAPVNKAIPFVIKPEEVSSGIPNYYASSYIDGNDYCSIVVKTREGRPIKIEGNELSGMTRGGTSAQVQASVLSLYDEERLRGPLHRGNQASWQRIDEIVIPMLQSFNQQGRNIAILSPTIYSPSTRSIFNDFLETYPNTRIVYYDSISASGILKANERTFKQAVIPGYRFDNANVILSFGADFLGTWLSPVEYTKQYVKNRKLDGNKTMSKHIQFETGMSLTGSNADDRHLMLHSEEGVLLRQLYNMLANGSGSSDTELPKPSEHLSDIAGLLQANKRKSLVVSGSNDESNQIIVNAINVILENYGSTIDLNVPLYLKQGTDQEMSSLVSDMNNGVIDALLINDVNPVYDYPESEEFVKGLKKLKLSISLSSTLDETASLVNYVCPTDHYLESWNDAEPKRGFFSLAQPVINRLFDTRSSQESLLRWINAEITYHDYIKAFWENNIYPLAHPVQDIGFSDFWIKGLQDGVYEMMPEDLNQPEFDFNDIETIIRESSNREITSEKSFELHLYESVGMGSGRQSNNPWLQELPDPISKVCWDNYASISPRLAAELDLEIGDIISISDPSRSIELPVLVQPGQAPGSISIALGYGRSRAGKVGDGIGKNVFQFAKIVNGNIQYSQSGIKISKTPNTHDFAMTQTHYSMEGRAIVRETTLEEYIKNPSSGNELHEFAKEAVSMYEKPLHVGYHWSLSIDLNACTGCGNCIIACQAENNVPVIGKDEVRNRRIMHWIRIDRYYSESIDNPKVYHQPIMCQHCDNAPCENVCPVAATMHSDDGLNHMTYNRCIGTRYCMNNCPYKVRRFNWYAYSNNDRFDYHMNSDYGRMVLNPDVVVRSRGVAEKCSMCVQRIQEKKALAKLENRALHEDEIKPACMQSCPGDAIVFGNRNNKEGVVSRKFADERNYGLLEEIHSLPSVGYLVKVRNNPGKIG